MISDYIKITTWIVFSAICFVGYDEGVRPYVSAYSETKELLIEAAIPLEESNTGKYQQRSIAVLQENCTNGVHVESNYDFRCEVDSPLPYLAYQFFSGF